MIGKLLRRLRIHARKRNLAKIRRNRLLVLIYPLGCTDAELERDVYGDSIAYIDGDANA